MYNSVYDNPSGYFSQYYSSNLPALSSQSLTGELDSLVITNGSGSTTSGCTSSSYIGLGSPTSPVSCCNSSYPPNSTTSVFQRSLSSQSLQKNGLYTNVSSPLSSIPDLDICPVRRVLSTGDLDQGVKTSRGGSPLASETTSMIIEGMTKACRYSPEEKRERIERYRSKRTQRNFNKKIQYACRKTLADSRPRIRGRFARNDELERTNNSPELQWNPMAGEGDDEDEEQWNYLLDSISSI